MKLKEKLSYDYLNDLLPVVNLKDNQNWLEEEQYKQFLIGKLENIYLAGFEKALEMAAEVIKLKPYGTLDLPEDKVNWNRESLSLMLKDIQKIGEREA